MGRGAKSEAKTFLRLHGAQYRRELKRTLRDVENFRKRANKEFRRIGIAIALVAAASTLIGANLEQSLANVQSITHATVAEMQALEGAAREMGATTAYTATQAADALYKLASAGLTTKEVIQTLEPTMKLAGATQSDMAMTSEALTKAMAMFRLESGDSTRIANVYAASIAETHLTMDRLSDAMRMGGPVAAALGLSLEESTAILGAFHRGGLEAGQAGVYFKNVMVEMRDKMRTATGDIGKALQEWDGHNEGLVGGLRRLEEAGVTAETAIDELGRRAGPGLAILLTQGSSAIEQLINSVSGTNQAFEAYDIQLNTTQGRFKIFVSALQEGALRIWGVIKGPLNTALESMTQFVRNNFDKITEAARNVANVVGGVYNVFKTLMEFIGKHTNTVKLMAEAVVLLVAALYTLATVLKIINVIQKKTVIGLITLAVYGLSVAVVALVKHFGGWNTLWIKTKGVAREALVYIVTGVKLLWLEIKRVGDMFVALGRIFDAVVQYMSGSLEVFATLMTSVFASVWDAIKSPFSSGDVMAEIKDAFAVGMEELALIVFDSVDGIWDGLSDEYDLTKENILAEHAALLEKIKAETAAALGELGKSKATGDDTPDTKEDEWGPAFREAGGVRPEADMSVTGEKQKQSPLFSRMEVEIRKAELLFASLENTVDKVFEAIGHSGTAMWDKLSEAASKGTILQKGLHVVLLKSFVHAMREGAAAFIEAKGKEAAISAMTHLAAAVGSAAYGNFGAAAKHALAAAKYGAIAGVAAVAANIVRGGGGVGRDDENVITDTGRGGRTTIPVTGSAQGASASGGQVVNLKFEFKEAAIMGDAGVKSFLDRNVIPHIRKALKRREV